MTRRPTPTSGGWPFPVKMWVSLSISGNKLGRIFRIALTNHQKLTRFNSCDYSLPIPITPLKIRRKIRFFLSTRKICPIRIADQYSKSKTDNELKTDLQFLSYIPFQIIYCLIENYHHFPFFRLTF